MIFLFVAFFTFFDSSSVLAHSDKNHSPCTTPVQSTQYESRNPWSAYYTYDQAKHRWEADWRYSPPYSYTDSKGNTYSGGGYWYDAGKWVDDGYQFATAGCSISFQHTPFDQIYSTGVIDYWNVVASGSPGGTGGPTSGTVYWVIEVDIYVTDGNGRTYLQNNSNGTSQTPTLIDGNPSNSNNTGLTTYSDEDLPSVTCIKTYGDGSKRGCSPYPEIDRNYNGQKGQRLTCYRWIDPHTNDNDKVCTVRIYVKDVKITSGADTTYTGKHYNYECQATFYDGTVRVISQNPKKNQKYVWLSYPQEKSMSFYDGRYIGSHWERGYLDPRDTYHPPDSLHDFYPADSENRTYILNCTYYPGIQWVQQYYGSSWNTQWDRVRQNNGIISDYDSGPNGTWHIPKHDKKTVKHIGIKEMWVETTGEFALYNEGGKTWVYKGETLKANKAQDNTFPGGWNAKDTVNNKTYAPGYWNQYPFLTGHWYDFQAYITYTDGTKRDVTSAEEVYWDNTPWFKNQQKFNVKNIYDSGMSKTGLDHRIPQHGWNTIDVEFFHRNVPFGKTEVNRTKVTNRLKSRQLKELKITHQDDSDIPLVNNIKTHTINAPGDPKVVQYHAWITWTDGIKDVKEDWSNFVRWDGDYLQNPKNVSITDEWETHTGGLFDFSPMKGKGQRTTVYADYKDIDDLIIKDVTRVTDDNGTTQTKTYDSGNPNWEANHDKVEVVVNDCENIPHLAWECPLPTDYWRIDLENRFDIFGYSDEGRQNHNFYPDPSYYKVGSWNDETDLYMYQRKFPVSGTSSGLGNK